MKQTPIITRELARRIEHVDIDYARSRLEGMQQAEGNPLQIEIKQYGTATAFLIKAWPDFWYGNKVVGLDPSCTAYLEEILRFFQQQDLAFRIEIIPGNLNIKLAARLHRLGFYQVGFSTAMYGVPMLQEKGSREDQVQVQEVQAEDLNAFIDLYQDGFQMDRLTGEEKRIVRRWCEAAAADLHLYVAYLEGRPAGVGVLYVKDDVGLLADAATLPGVRGRGCQSALIRQRMAQAIARGCELITSFVEFGSVSQRNVQKAGLRVAYMKAMWMSG